MSADLCLLGSIQEEFLAGNLLQRNETIIEAGKNEHIMTNRI